MKISILDLYLKTARVAPTTDPHVWWARHVNLFPKLAKFAKIYHSSLGTIFGRRLSISVFCINKNYIKFCVLRILVYKNHDTRGFEQKSTNHMANLGRAVELGIPSS